MYSIFKVPIGSHMYKYGVHLSSYDEAIFSSTGERDLVYMYMLHNKQLVIRTVYICNLLCKYIVQTVLLLGGSGVWGAVGG